MEKHFKSMMGIFAGLLQKCLFSVLSFGPISKHIAFIMDGNRRYTKKRGFDPPIGYRSGFAALTTLLEYSYEMGIKYVTAFAFSIDNFRRTPEEVEILMGLTKEKIDELLKEESIVRRYGIKINFIGNLNIIDESVRLSVEEAMASTAYNTELVLTVVIAYTSTHEIEQAIEKSCRKVMNRRSEEYCNGSKRGEIFEEGSQNLISVSDLEENLYTAGYPDPDILVRTSGETRLSDFLLWQTSFCHLQNPKHLWPEFSLWDIVWSVLEYQKVHCYLEA